MVDIRHEIDTLANGGLTAEIIDSLQNYYFNKALVTLMTPISEGFYQKAFTLYKPVVAPFMDNDGKLHPEVDDEELGQPITKSKNLYLASDDDFKLVVGYHNFKIREAGFDAKEGLCPFLVAEHELRNATGNLIDVMERYTGMNQASFILIEDKNKYVTYLLGILGTIADSHKIDLKRL
ncbi:MAG: hypothetical protein V7749_00755 [Cocleimonas sp.]